MAGELVQSLTLTTLAMTLAMLIVILLRTPLRRMFGARIAYLAWWLVPAVMLTLLLPAPVREVANFTHGTMFAVTVPLQAIQARSTTVALPDYRLWLTVIWLLGVGFAALLFHRMQRRYVRALGRVAPGDAGIYISQAKGAGPAVVGAWRPRIVLPADFETRYPLHEGQLVLAHERVHLHRGDAAFNLLAVVLRCVYWFNPLLHWAATRFRQDQEMACDATVLEQFPDRRRSYAEAMLKTQLAVLGLPVGCHWQSSQSLKERIIMLKKPLPGRARKRIGVFTLAAALSASSYGVWALQPASPNRAPAYIGNVLWGNMADVDIQTDQKAERIDLTAGSIQQAPDGLIHVHMNGISPLQLNVGEGQQGLQFDAQVTNTVAKTPTVVWTLKRNAKRIDQGRINLSSVPQKFLVGGTAWGTKSSAVLTFKMPTGQTIVGHLPRLLKVDNSGHYAVEDSVLIGDEFKDPGSADLALHLSATGQVQRVDIERVSPAAAFTQQEAIDLTNGMRFEPRIRDGVAVATLVRTTVHFAPNSEAIKAPPAWFRPAADEVKTTPENVGVSMQAAPAVSVLPDRPLSFKEAPAPDYPVDEISQVANAKVMVILDVDATGAVTHAQVDSSNPPTAFDEAVLKAVKKWKFNPSIVGGKAVPGRVKVPITFEADTKSPGVLQKAKTAANFVWKSDVDKLPIRFADCDVLRIDDDSRSYCGIRATVAGK